MFWPGGEGTRRVRVGIVMLDEIGVMERWQCVDRY